MLQYFKDTISTLFNFSSIYWVNKEKLLLVARGNKSLGLGAWTSWLCNVCWLGIITSNILRIPKRMYSRLVNVLGIYIIVEKWLARLDNWLRWGLSSILDFVKLWRDYVMNASTSFSYTLHIFSSFKTFYMIITLILTMSFFQSGSCTCPCPCPDGDIISLLKVANSFSVLCLSPELHFYSNILHLSESDRITWIDCLKWLKNSERETGSARIRNWFMELKSSSPDLIFDILS